jgi:2-polyprenyl-6-hydroxyphenyl methylase/3-demethylubiquinone-9 3-methyltransferase
MKFSFGRNWLSYSQSALDQDKIERAREAFGALTRGIELRGARFLDIGFGQGLPLFLAAEAGADAFGIDVDPVCGEALETTGRFFPSETVPRKKIVSILDDDFVRTQQSEGGFDVVHSWGVLHHTGNMAKAFRNAASLVKPGGFLIISIYNKHWSSPVWLAVKYLFNHVPRFLQKAMAWALYPLFRSRARALYDQESVVTSRGMDLAHDISDWLGGYPYEYASPAEIKKTFGDLGLTLVRCDPTKGFTGCNEFVFQKAS